MKKPSVKEAISEKVSTKNLEVSEKKSEIDDEQIDTDFDIVNPCDGHYACIKALLISCLRGVVNFEAASTTEAICSQGNCGSVVVSDPEDPDTVVGFSTLMNFKQWESKVQGIAEMKSSILANVEKRALDKNTVQKFTDAIKSPSCAALIRATVVNIPQPVLPHMLSNVIADAAWSVDECPPELKDFYRFKHVIFVDRVKIHCNLEGSAKVDPSLITEEDVPEEKFVASKPAGEAPKGEEDEENVPSKKRAKTAETSEKKKKTLKQPTAVLYKKFRDLCQLVLTGSEDEIAKHEGEELPSLDLAALVLQSQAIVMYATGREVEDSVEKTAAGEKKKISCAFEFGILLALPYKAVETASAMLNRINT